MSRKAKPTPKRAAPAPLLERTASEVVRQRMQDYAEGPREGRVTLYSGICDGGPYHGKPLHHGLPLIRVARSTESFKVVTWFGDETDKIRIDEYRHQDGRWLWRETT